MLAKAAALSALVVGAAGHGAIVSPRSRNSVDYLVGVNTPKDWASNKDCTNITGKTPADCHNGQAGFYYSQGCFIGCPECDHKSGRRQIDLCGKGFKATVNDPKMRSVNRNATAGSPEDIYKHNPWRAPGAAPVGDVCGFAGGTPWMAESAEAGDYTNTTYAHHGTRGSTLPHMDTGVIWTVGKTAEVTWQVLNNHGGGYSYRLCPLEEPLTEACFQKHPLEFVTTEQAIVDRKNQVTPNPAAVFVTEGTTPPGSMWSMIPIPTDALGPRCLPGPDDNNETTPHACQAWEHGLVDGPCVPCPQTAGSDCSRCDNNWDGHPSFPPPKAGDGVAKGSDHMHAIRDVLKVPADLKPGKYVLGWRYDCEATAQVWANCADITLAK